MRWSPITLHPTKRERKVRGDSPYRRAPPDRSFGGAMPSYLIESYLPRSRCGELRAAVDRLRRATESLSAEGTQVRHLRSTFVPNDEICLHLLEADSAALVGEASRRAAIEPARVVQALPVAPSDAPGGAP